MYKDRPIDPNNKVYIFQLCEKFYSLRHNYFQVSNSIFLLLINTFYNNTFYTFLLARAVSFSSIVVCSILGLQKMYRFSITLQLLYTSRYITLYVRDIIFRLYWKEEEIAFLIAFIFFEKGNNDTE